MKTRVAMLFGGKSVEHEVSVISGIQAVMNMDTDKDRKSTRLNSSHYQQSRMPSSA